MELLTFEVTGRIYKDPESETGMYVSVIDAWGISTAGRTVDEAVEMTHRLIDAHLDSAKRLGVLERELAKVGVSSAASSPPARVHVRTRFAVESEADISIH